MQVFIQGSDTPPTRGTDHTPSMLLDKGDITADHSPAPIYTVPEAAALESTSHVHFILTTAAHTTLQLMEDSIIPCTVIPTGIVASHLTLTITPTDATHITPQTEASLSPVAPTMQHKVLSQGR